MFKGPLKLWIKLRFIKEMCFHQWCMFGETFLRDLQTPGTLGVLENVLLPPLFPCFLLINRISDSTHLKKRLYFSTVHKDFSATPLHARIPFVSLKQNIVSIQPIPSTPPIMPPGAAAYTPKIQWNKNSVPLCDYSPYLIIKHWAVFIQQT